MSPAQGVPAVGEKYIATDNAQAIAALTNSATYPVPRGVIYVTIKKVWDDVRKVQVRPDGMWLTYDELARWFRRVRPNRAASDEKGRCVHGNVLGVGGECPSCGTGGWE
jgi:hypothetical protein